MDASRREADVRLEEGLLVPEGYLHRSVLIERGWPAKLVNELFTPDDTVIVDAPAGMSNKCYRQDVVEQLEASHREVKRLVTNRALQIPRREEGYSREETVPRSALVEKGWTPTLIERYLGEPDLTGHSYAGRSPAFLYARERVAQAEVVPEVVRRLETVAEKTSAKKEQRIAETVEHGFGVWRKHPTAGWVVQVRGVDVGDEVKVAKKNGDVEAHRVTGVVEDKAAGGLLVRVAPVKPAPQRSSGRVVSSGGGRATPAQVAAIKRHVYRGDHDGHWMPVPTSDKAIESLSKKNASIILDSLRHP